MSVRSATGVTYKMGEWSVDPAANRLFCVDREVRVEPKVMRVLAYLMERHGEVVSRHDLEANVWSGMIVTDDAVTNTVIKLRKALGDNARNPKYIETISKSGYRLIADVRNGEDDQSSGDPSTSHQSEQRPRQSRLVWIGILLIPIIVILWILIHRQGFVGKSTDAVPQESHAIKPSIAVLPFKYLNSNEGSNYFSDGITAEVITSLSKISGLQVISRDSAFSYREAHGDNAAIGQELGAGFLLRGNLQKEQDRIRLNVHLVETRTGKTVWAERYDRLLTDIFQIQDELAERIVLTLEVKLAPEERKRIIGNYLASLDAYDAFLRGVDYYTKRSFSDNQLAIESFSKAIEIDPDFARAYAGLALAYSWASGDDRSGDAEQAHRLASETVDKAIQIDASIPQVYFVKGRIELYKKNYEIAIQQIQKAIDIEPSYADAYALLASTLHFSGNPKEGLEAMKRAALLNPRIPAAYLMIRGSLHYSNKEYDLAVKDLSRSLEINPNYLQSKVWLAATYAAQGRPEDAQWEVDEIRMLAPDIDFGWVERAYPIQDFHYKERFRRNLEQAGVL